MERAAAGQRGHLVERHERAPQHDGVAEVVDAAAPGPAGELGVLPRRQELVVVAGELGQLLDHDVLAGMLMPTASVSVANTTLTRPSTKQASTTSLNGGTIPAWWAATPASSWARNVP